MGKVIQFPGETTLALDADWTLGRLKGELSSFVLAGYDKDGKEFFSSTLAGDKRGEVLWLLERFKKALLEMEDLP